MPDRSIEEVLAEHTPELMSLPGVVGTGLGMVDGASCILVLVEDAAVELTEQIPDQLDGFVVTVHETGQFEAHGRESRF